ncbi:hypothetical protein QQF64_024989 [Cirrhinus molitorella]|uniref:Small EDRK-rich factor-like N-terminal domain-containing protein n=1 Tax=Cirrhinus molitorella TaxID=172907 RepID=A0ABR3NNT8_9TELE
MKGADGLLGPQACSYWENSSLLRYCCCGLVCQRARGKSQPGSEDTHTHSNTLSGRTARERNRLKERKKGGKVGQSKLRDGGNVTEGVEEMEGMEREKTGKKREDWAFSGARHC